MISVLDVHCHANPCPLWFRFFSAFSKYFNASEWFFSRQVWLPVSRWGVSFSWPTHSAFSHFWFAFWMHVFVSSFGHSIRHHRTTGLPKKEGKADGRGQDARSIWPLPSLELDTHSALDWLLTTTRCPSWTGLSLCDRARSRMASGGDRVLLLCCALHLILFFAGLWTIHAVKVWWVFILFLIHPLLPLLFSLVWRFFSPVTNRLSSLSVCARGKRDVSSPIATSSEPNLRINHTLFQRSATFPLKKPSPSVPSLQFSFDSSLVSFFEISCVCLRYVFPHLLFLFLFVFSDVSLPSNIDFLWYSLIPFLFLDTIFDSTMHWSCINLCLVFPSAFFTTPFILLTPPLCQFVFFSETSRIHSEQHISSLYLTRRQIPSQCRSHPKVFSLPLRCKILQLEQRMSQTPIETHPSPAHVLHRPDPCVFGSLARKYSAFFRFAFLHNAPFCRASRPPRAKAHRPTRSLAGLQNPRSVSSC